MRMYVIKAVSGREDRSLESIRVKLKAYGLEDKIERLLIPVERRTEVKRGKRVTTKHKLYPGYIYAIMQPENDVLETIREVDGVTGFLGSDPALPEALAPDEAERIIQIADAESVGEQRAAIVQIPYEIGDKVRVKDGTFEGMDGVVDGIDTEKGQLKVLMTVFGRQTPIDLEVWQVEELS